MIAFTTSMFRAGAASLPSGCGFKKMFPRISVAPVGMLVSNVTTTGLFVIAWASRE